MPWGRNVTVVGMLNGRFMWVRMSHGQFMGGCKIKAPGRMRKNKACAKRENTFKMLVVNEEFLIVPDN
jgi:hypothetical protein